MPMRQLVHTTIDETFVQSSVSYAPMRSVDVVRKRSLQAVVSRSDDKCVTRLVGEMTSLSVS